MGALQIHSSAVVRRCRATGWTRQDYPRPETLVFVNGGLNGTDQQVEAVIPSSSTARDFTHRVINLLELLAAIEDRTTAEVASEIAKQNIDRLRIGLYSSMSASGSIPLSLAPTLAESLYNLVVAAACTEENPSPYYEQSSPLSRQFADGCKFGQTEEGSFIVNIECPVTPFVAQDHLAVPFTRRVTERIMTGLHQVHSAVLEGRKGLLLPAYKSGFSANMCDALLGLYSKASDLELEALLIRPKLT